MVYESLPVIIHLAALVVIVILVVVSELVDVVGSLALRSSLSFNPLTLGKAPRPRRLRRRRQQRQRRRLSPLSFAPCHPADESTGEHM